MAIPGDWHWQLFYKWYRSLPLIVTCGLLAQGLLRGVQYWLMPDSEWRRSLKSSIKRVVERPVVLTRSSRRHRLSFG